MAQRMLIRNTLFLKVNLLKTLSHLMFFHSHEPSRLCEGDPGDRSWQAGERGGDGEVDVEGTSAPTDRAAEFVFIPQFLNHITFSRGARSDRLPQVDVLEHIRCRDREDGTVKVKGLNVGAVFCPHLHVNMWNQFFQTLQWKLTGMVCREKEMGQARLRVGGEKANTEQLRLQK